MKRDLGLGLVCLAILALVALRFPQFVRPAQLGAIADDTAILIILALGQMVVLLTRGVDLSVAATIALSGMLAAMLNSHAPQIGLAPVILVAVISGTLLGAFNGWMVWKLDIPPIVATLATMAIYRGLVFLLSGGLWYTNSTMSPSFLALVRVNLLGVSLTTWCAILAVGGFGLLLNRSRLGRHAYAAGSNPQAALYAGIAVGRVQFLAFTLSGMCGGLCGYLWVAKFAIAYTDVALGFELQVIAACVIGGVSIRGGGGTVTGVLLGALLLGIIKNAMPLIGISPFWQMAVSGLVIVIAVVLSARSARVSRRRILEQVPA